MDREAGTMIVMDPSQNTLSTIKVPLRHEAERATMPHVAP
jgi:hypothetical protein